MQHHYTVLQSKKLKLICHFGNTWKIIYRFTAFIVCFTTYTKLEHLSYKEQTTAYSILEVVYTK